MAYIMYVCPECRKVYKIDGTGKKTKCLKCSSAVLMDTAITEETWITYSPDKKGRIISDLFEEPEIIEVVEDEKDKITDKVQSTEKSNASYSSFFDIDSNNGPNPSEIHNTSEPIRSMNSSSGATTKSSNISHEYVAEKKKYSKLSIVALILSILGCSAFIGLILSIIDLVKGKYDDRRHILSKIGIGFSIANIIFGVLVILSQVSGGTVLSKAQPLELVEYGMYMDPPSLYNDSAYIDFCGIIHNPNEKLIAEYPKVIITIKNPDGTILATEEQTGSIIMPGDTITLCGMLSMPIGDVTDDTQVVFNVECSEFNTESKLHEAIRTSDLAISNVSEHNGDYENLITGTITNNSKYNTDMANVSMILRKNGKIVYLENTFVDSLPAGSTKAFEFQRYERWPDHDKIECSAMVW